MKLKSLSLNLSIFTFFLFLETSSSVHPYYEACEPKPCGNQNISFPFWIPDEQESYCGYPGFNLTCQYDHPVLQIPDNNYNIQQIFYHNQSLRISNSAVFDPKNVCVPQIRNLSLEVDKFEFTYNYTDLFLLSNCSVLPRDFLKYKIGCDKESENFWDLAVFGNDGILNSALESCEKRVLAPVELYGNDQIGGYLDVLKRGFVLKWKALNCSWCLESGGRCGFDSDTHRFLCYCPDRPSLVSCGSRRKWNLEAKVATGVGASVIGLVLFLWFLRHRSGKSMIFWIKENSINQNFETILKNCGPLATKRYNYSDVKKMTNSFKEKLGQGGYGAVYKGKLQNGEPIAVKVLNESKGDGEEFINEVMSISRTSHVNVVTLLGFCFEGHKRALIYEFMHNGSLDMFISDDSSLGWETLYKIAIGIARGLEYLHRGCNTRILHFDIKPHNILLDEDFCPKISDFGLAKLCPKKESIVSMLGTRGTIGYIAPEVFSRNFGGVSHKSDVYSYGMMILDMVGGTKNDHTSEVYFPDWIYRRLENDQEIGQRGITCEEENEKARKMTIVGLLCIQTDPSSRPSMSRVVGMLEGSLESLQIPSRPVLSSPPRAMAADSSATDKLFCSSNSCI